jgi:hypothetical protein
VLLDFIALYVLQSFFGIFGFLFIQLIFLKILFNS